MEVKEGDEVKAKQLVSILEAMKLEINVNAPESVAGGTAVIEKLLIEPGETIRAGGRIALVRKT